MELGELQGFGLRLEPITAEHLTTIGDEILDPRLWEFSLERVVTHAGLQRWLEHRLRQIRENDHQTFAIVTDAGNTIGSTTIYNKSNSNKRATLGYTWIVPSEWGKGRSHASKVILLDALFGKWGANRIDFNVDERNRTSRISLERFGARQEGILRQHIVLPDGFVRNTVVYSIVKSEYDSIRQAVVRRLR